MMLWSVSWPLGRKALADANENDEGGLLWRLRATFQASSNISLRLLKHSKKRGGSATIEELEDDVAELMKLSDDILAVPHKDGPGSQFQYELAWVRTYLKKAGIAENSKRGLVPN